MWKLEEYKPSAAHVAAFQSVSREKLQEVCNAISSWPEHRMAECDKARGDHKDPVPAGVVVTS